MKKIIIAFAALMMTCLSYAQEKGEMYLKGSLGLSGGKSKHINTSEASTTTTSTPGTLAFEIAPEFGYFVADNLKLALELSYDMTRTPSGDIDGTKLYAFDNDFYLTPNVSYYVRIAKGFHYTPGVDLYVGFGNRKTQIDASNTEKAYAKTNVGFRLILCAFEYRVSNHFAFTLELGDFGLSSVTRKTNDANKTVYTNVGLNLQDQTSVGFKYYF